MKRVSIILFSILICLSLGLVGCGKNKKPKDQIDLEHYPSGLVSQTPDKNEKEMSGTPSVEDIEAAMKKDSELFIVVATDTSEKSIKLGYPDSNKIIQYLYGDMTDFFDRYGSYTTVARIAPGTIVTVGRLDADAKLTQVKVSDETWYQNDVKKYTIDIEKGMLQIGTSKYFLGDNTRIFSNGSEIRLDQIQKMDVISVQGLDKDILSIVVEKGHGTIALTNTDTFEGGWLSLGTSIYTKVEPNMTMVVPEGRYELSVANDGYGDSKKIRVKRGKITVVDLNDYLGEGPSMCNLTFEVYIDNAELYIDGEVVDYSEPIQVKYGVHDLVVIAPGYEEWKQKLAVGSADATLQIGEKDLTSREEKEEDKKENKKDEESEDKKEDTSKKEYTQEEIDDIVNNAHNHSQKEDVQPYIDTLNTLLDSLLED